MRELRVIVESNRVRSDTLLELWDELTYAEQDEVLAHARSLAPRSMAGLNRMADDLGRALGSLGYSVKAPE
jgi:hypothetical protein